jgi:hypothetical protein
MEGRGRPYGAAIAGRRRGAHRRPPLAQRAAGSRGLPDGAQTAASRGRMARRSRSQRRSVSVGGGSAGRGAEISGVSNADRFYPSDLNY